jgi:UDP-2-acetamido-2,6-beta-L-arabino-hexul-4-ose reductase
VRVAVTGASGFLGWHLRCRLKALRHDVDVVSIDRQDFARMSQLIDDIDAIIHVAGINRGTDDELSTGNVELAQTVVAAVRAQGGRPRIVFANTIRAGDGTPYGDGKEGASYLLGDYTTASGCDFVEVILPNLFGEHGRPDHNSFVATFCHEVAAGRVPEVIQREVELLHVQDAAQSLIDALGGPTRTERPEGDKHGVAEVLELLLAFDSTYRRGEIPALGTAFKADLFNAYRAAAFENRPGITLESRTDPRGHLVEAVKSHGGGGQTFFSASVPGATRGDHFHLRKVERFVVIEGRARIRLRKLFASDVLHIDVSGDAPVAVDMPTLWAHNITNTGDTDLLTLFWTDSVFDPDRPDTYPEPVAIDGTEIEVTT